MPPIRALILCCLLLALPANAGERVNNRVNGRVETRSKIRVSRSGEATVNTSQTRTASNDSTLALGFETAGTVEPKVFRDSITPSDPFDYTTFDEDVDEARETQFLLLRKMKRPEVMERDSTDWWFMFKHGKLSFRDPYIHWPRGTMWAVRTIRFIDRILNAQDSAYITGTGYRFKFYATTENWFDSYSMNFNNIMPMMLMSDLTSSLGLYVNAIGLSLGYSVDMTNILGGRTSVCHKWRFGVDTELFSAAIHRYTNDGGTYIRGFGSFNNGEPIHLNLPGMRMANYGAEFYFYINNRRYSRAAAYSFSKIQKKSAGSLIVGMQYNNLNLDMDLSSAPPVLMPYMKIEPRAYRFHYNNYAFVIGYGHNFVMGKHFLLNITGLPGLGWNHCYEDSVEGAGELVSLNVKGGLSLVYNNKAFFCAAGSQMEGHWYRSLSYSMFDSLMLFTAHAGIRF